MKQRPKLRSYDAEYYELMNKNDENPELPNGFNTQLFVETTLSEGDTLQSLSIRYRCSVSELKRINNLHRDNEIFARRTIKVPYRTFSMVAIHRSGDSSPNTDAIKKSVNANILKEKLASVSTDIDKTNLISNYKETNLFTSNFSYEEQNLGTNLNEIVFNTYITNNEVINNQEESDCDEEVHLLPKINSTKPSNRDFDCSGSDWGLSWPILLAIILLTAFIGPLIYILYIAEHPEKYHHHVS